MRPLFSTLPQGLFLLPIRCLIVWLKIVSSQNPVLTDKIALSIQLITTG